MYAWSETRSSSKIRTLAPGALRCVPQKRPHETEENETYENDRAASFLASEIRHRRVRARGPGRDAVGPRGGPGGPPRLLRRDPRPHELVARRLLDGQRAHRPRRRVQVLQ